MTPYFFMMVYAAGVGAAFVRGPLYGLYLYVFAFYFSPYRTWWEDQVPDLRYLQIAAIVTVIATVLHGTWWQQGKNQLSRGVWLMIVFVLWIWLTSLWSITGDWQAQGRTLFTKHLIMTLLIVIVIRNFREVRDFLLANVVGCAWLGWLAWGKTGSRLEGVAGALADANTLGMHLSAGLLIAGLMFLGCRGYHRWISFACIPLILNTVILSGSRGAFLGLLAGGLWAAWYCPASLKPRFAFAGALGLVLFGMLASQSFLERVESITAIKGGAEAVNETAGGRADIAKAGWEMFKDFPMGTGYKGTAVLSPGYVAEHLLTAGGTSRSAHNSLLSVLVDFTLVGLGLYLLMYFWMWRTLGAVNRKYKHDWQVASLATGIAGALMVVLVAGQASDYYYAEIQYWLLGLTAVLWNLSKNSAASTESESMAKTVAGPGRLLGPPPSPLRKSDGPHPV